ncbi:hypothetical protein [Streptomyces sp. NBC_01637]|uniref:hypothetical protein n=1 Tax=unclassified Streptomyces TaxID=2593676 RepID=UPI0038638188|nr:hypothetical protein OH719_20725 [Streptomyces sp. NBC_01653]WTD90792.1 hypothetical protein OG891_26155 [Streptomyces sp. NBC_01637]
MADEQHEWLDKDAAERLLRGEPVDPVDGHARTEAVRLVAALAAAAREARPAAGELPGEAAALAAFRAVPRAARTRGRSETRAAQPTGHAAQSSEPEQMGQSGRGVRPGLPETLGAIRIGPASSAQFPLSSSSGAGMRSRRWRRPLRFGLAASLAGCALGGVAVAAGTGVLPGPFGGHANPLPASSVSAPASPGELGSGPTSDRTPVPPPASPRPDTSPDPAGPSASGDGTRRGDGGANDRDGRGGTDGKDGGYGDDVDAAPRSADGTARDTTSGGGQGGTSGKWLGRTVRACRDYREGDLDADRRRRLVVMARGAGNLDRFCKRVLEQADGDGGDAQQGSGSGSDEGTGSDGPDAVRSLWFKPATMQPSRPALLPVPGTTASTR